MEQKYTAKKWTAKVMLDELVSRGFDEADLVDMSEEELRDQLIADDAGSEDTDPVDPEDGSEDESEEDDDSKKSESPKAKAPKGEFVDIVSGEEYIRTYSKEVHGDDFLKLAESFANQASKRERKMLDAGEIKSLRVSFRVQDKKPGDNQGAWIPMSQDFGQDRAAALVFVKSKLAVQKAVILWK